MILRMHSVTGMMHHTYVAIIEIVFHYPNTFFSARSAVVPRSPLYASNPKNTIAKSRKA